MKKRFSALALALLLCLAACGPDTAEVTPTPTATPAQSPTATAPPEGEPSPAPTPTPTPEPQPPLSEFLEQILSAEEYTLSCFIFSGSGPMPVPLYADECEDTIRELFSSLDWQDGEGTERDWEDGDFSVYLGTRELNMPLAPWCNSCEVIAGGGYDHDPKNPIYHADGAEDLYLALANLWPGPHVRYAMVQVAEQDDPQAVAEDYAQAFEELYLASGYISDFRLNSVKYNRSYSEEYGGIYFNISFAVKPTDPTLRAWSDDRFGDKARTDKDGWLTYQYLIQLYGSNDGFYRMYDFACK